jgi:PAS domain S-box-containing protein
MDGYILEVLANSFGEALPLTPGTSLADVLDSGSLDEFESFLTQTRNEGDAFDWELNLVLGPDVIPANLHAAVRQGSLFIMGTQTQQGMLCMLDESLSMNNELVAAVRELRRQLSALRSAPTDQSIDDLMRLNNELTNLQREMAKRNVELQRSNHVNQTILDTTPDLIFVYDLQRRRLISFNRSVERALGLAPETLRAQGAGLNRIFPSQAQIDEFEAQVAKLLQGSGGGVVEWDAEASAAGGGIIWLRIRATVFEWSLGSARSLLVAATDTTLEHEAQLALERGAERLRAVMDTMLDPHLVLAAVRDQSGEVVDFEVTDANAAAGALDGSSAAELLGMHLLERFPRWGTTGAQANQKRVVETGEPLVLDDVPSAFAPEDSGRRLDIRSVRFGDGVSVTLRDVTARHEAERAIRRRVAELDTLQRMSALLVQRIDVDTALNSVCSLLAALFGASLLKVRVFAEDPGAQHHDYVVACAPLFESAEAEADAIAAALSSGHNHAVAAPSGEQLLAVPLVAEAETVGVLVIIRAAASGAFAGSEQAVAGTAADLLAAVVRNERFHKYETQQAATLERQRIARDLHDAVTQSIYSANLLAEVLPAVFERQPAQALEDLAVIRRLIRAAFAELRILLFELRPETLAAAPLETLLERLCDALRGHGDLAVELEVAENLTMPAEVRTVMYRVAQEALNNVGKYASATRVVVKVDRDGPDVRLTVADNGCGFDNTAVPSGSLGHSIMRERAASIDGSLSIEGIPGAGTVVTLRWRTSRRESKAD